MMLQQDPWSAEKKINFYFVKTDEIESLPKSLDDIRGISLLAAEDNMHLVLQFSDDLWSIPLRNPEKVALILDPEVRRIKHR